MLKHLRQSFSNPLPRLTTMFTTFAVDLQCEQLASNATASFHRGIPETGGMAVIMSVCF